MTKQEVLQDIDKLCGEIDKWTGIRVKAMIQKDVAAKEEASCEIWRIVISAHQELSFLRDYIDENIKEE